MERSVVRRTATLAVAALACAGCQLVLGIDTNVPIVDGGPTPCTSQNAILCDDFEEGAIDNTRWQQVEQISATVTVDSIHAHWGSWALHATTDAVVQTGGANPGGYVDNERTQPFPQDFFVRFFLYVPSPSVAPTESQVIIDAVDGSGVGMQLTSVVGNLGFTDWAATPQVNLRSATVLQPDTWHCIEWEVTQGQPQGHMNVWVDETQVSDLDVPVTTPAFSVLKLGIGFYQPPVQPAYDVWIDDVRVDTSRIHCSS